MENFNWEDFKNGKVIVRFLSKEGLDEFLAECENHNIDWEGSEKATSFNCWSSMLDQTCLEFDTLKHCLFYGSYDFYVKSDRKIITWNFSTFEEVTSQIGEGEIYSNECVEISLIHDNELRIISKNGDFNILKPFKIYAKVVDFDEAIKKLKEGCSIKSLVSKINYTEIIDCNSIVENGNNKQNTLTISEILGKWQIVY